MNLGEAAMFLAVGFVPTLIALEMAYRMVAIIFHGLLQLLYP
jgi:hypothetical protein